MQITGIILSGGKSTRMGTDKALLTLNNKTLLQNAIEICKPVCQNILISSDNSNHKNHGYKTIPDEFKNCGPLGGIYSCLKKSVTDWNFVISVDAAFVKTSFIEALAKNTVQFDAVVPVHNKGKEPLISMFHKSVLTTMEKHLKTGNFKMHNLINALNTNFLDTQTWVTKYPQIFYNLNNPDDINFVSK